MQHLNKGKYISRVVTRQRERPLSFLGGKLWEDKYVGELMEYKDQLVSFIMYVPPVT